MQGKKHACFSVPKKTCRKIQKNSRAHFYIDGENLLQRKYDNCIQLDSLIKILFSKSFQDHFEQFYFEKKIFINLIIIILITSFDNSYFLYVYFYCTMCSGTGRVGTVRAGTGRVGTGRAGTGRAGTGRAGTGRAGTVRFYQKHCFLCVKTQPLLNLFYVRFFLITYVISFCIKSNDMPKLNNYKTLFVVFVFSNLLEGGAKGS